MSILKTPDLFFSSMRQALSETLPGELAQNRMSARTRISTDDWLEKRPDHKQSAVVLPLFFHAGEMHTSLILRPTYEGVHSGQLALPGGRYEEVDGSLIQTAIRETQEEVGILLNAEQLAGRLSPVYIPVSNFLVQPFVAFLAEKPSYTKQDAEVETIFDVPLRYFLNEELKTVERIVVGKNQFIDAPGYKIENRLLWGATAMMFSEMESLLLRIQGV
ncbi:MAG: NUDIX hydrolase [Bacteroidia bacterium]